MEDEATLQHLIEFLRIHPKVGGIPALLARVRAAQQQQRGSFPPGSAAHIARKIRKLVQADQSLTGKAWRAFQDIAGPVYDQWERDGVEPPDGLAVQHQPPPHSRALESNLHVARIVMRGNDSVEAKLFAGMTGLLIVDDVLVARMNQAFVGFTKGITQDPNIGDRKRHFLNLRWAPNHAVDLGTIRDRWAHCKWEIRPDCIRIYEDDAVAVVADFKVADIEALTNAALAALDAVWLTALIANAITPEPQSAWLYVLPPRTEL